MNSKKLSASIIIPNYNGQNLLARHLPKVVEAAGFSEIIVVDDASTDESVSWLKENFPEIKVIVNQKNQRYATSCNLGVAAAKGEIVILLNNDVSPSPDFLSHLLEPFDDPQVFAVGCLEYNSSKPNAQKSGRACGRFYHGQVIHQRCPDQHQKTTLWVSGGSGAFRKQMWQAIQGMDPLFKPAYEEDRDLSYRAQKRGWLVRFAPESSVIHEHESTNQDALGLSLMKRASYKNQFIFIWKNITQRQLFLNHLIWLPFNIVYISFQSRGEYLLGFLWALKYLPQILTLRQIEKKAVVIDDETIFAANT